MDNNIFHNPSYFNSDEPLPISLTGFQHIEENIRSLNANNTLNQERNIQQEVEEEKEEEEEGEDERYCINEHDIPYNNISSPNNINENNLPQNPTEASTKQTIPKFITTIIEKKERKKGRISNKNRPSNKVRHDKFSRDDITSKIKRLFVKVSRNYINKKYNELLVSKKKKKRILLRKINPEIYRKYSLKDNQYFFNLYLYQLFSENLSKKIKEYSEDYNRKQIKSLYEKNEAKEIINILNLTVKGMYQIYISNQIPEYSFENDLSKIIKEDVKESEEERIKYKNKVKKIAYDLIGYIFRRVL
jgi:hypothetical protein